MINWKVRMRNPMFWAQILLKAVSSPYILSLVIVSVYNAITDPTTTGFTDSKRALTYDTPNDDKE